MFLSSSTPSSAPEARADDVLTLQLFLEEGTSRVFEEAVLPKIAAGDSTAVKSCIDRYGNLIWSIARRFLGSGSEAEDAVQEIFVEIWKHAGKYQSHEASEKTFVTMIARRRLIDMIRKRSRQPISESLPDTIPIPAQQSRLEQDEQSGRILKAFEQLKPEQQRILKLAILSGHTHEAIAAETGIPLGTVKSTIRRGLIQVREILDSTLSMKGGK